MIMVEPELIRLPLGVHRNAVRLALASTASRGRPGKKDVAALIDEQLVIDPQQTRRSLCCNGVISWHIGRPLAFFCACARKLTARP